VNSPSSIFSINRPYDEVLPWLKQKLSQAGLRTMQTFDLNTVRPDPKDCPCPHHGTGMCNCQMVVLLVYGSAPEPATLILHGNDGQTWLSLIDHPGQRADTKTIAAIQRTLEIQASAGI
jgi:hypothetical protein